MSSIQVLDEVRAALDAAAAVDLRQLPAAELLVLVRNLELLRRRFDAVALAAVDEVARSGAYGIDGHTRPRAAVVALTRCSRRRRGAAEDDPPGRPGPVGGGSARPRRGPTGHLGVLAHVAANPRIAEAIAAHEAQLLDDARSMSVEDFGIKVRDWANHVDVDGAEQRAERRHASREAHLTTDFDGNTRIDARCGELQGAIVRSALDHFAQASSPATTTTPWPPAAPTASSAVYHGPLGNGPWMPWWPWPAPRPPPSVRRWRPTRW